MNLITNFLTNDLTILSAITLAVFTRVSLWIILEHRGLVENPRSTSERAKREENHSVLIFSVSIDTKIEPFNPFYSFLLMVLKQRSLFLYPLINRSKPSIDRLHL